MRGPSIHVSGKDMDIYLYTSHISVNATAIQKVVNGSKISVGIIRKRKIQRRSIKVALLCRRIVHLIDYVRCALASFSLIWARMGEKTREKQYWLLTNEP